MSSKAETISDLTSKQPRLSIFFRNPLLLKIVAWLGSLSFIGSSGIVWADLKPISTAGVPKQERINAPVLSSSAGSATQPERDIYGPSLPVAPKQPSTQIAPEQLPNREVPIAVAPSSAAISPTGTIVPPQHTDILTADNYTVGVNGSVSNPLASQRSIDILVPAPLSTKIPDRVRERVSGASSQLQPNYLRPRTTVNRTPLANSGATSSTNSYQTVPKVTSLPGVSNSTNNSTTFQPPVLTQMRPAVTNSRNLQPGVTPRTTASVPTTSPDSIQLAIPSPRSSRVEVRPVAQLPVVATRTIPTVPAIPSVRPAAMGRSPSTPMAFVNPGNERSTQIIYPLSSPAPTTSSFGWRTHPISGSRRFHSGVDIGAPMGAPVVAAGSGIIISAGWLGGYGKAIVIQHNGIQQTLYGHLSEVFVQPGQRIERGMVIGRVGSTGNSTGPHLHFETRVATSDGWIAIDPGEDIKYALDDLRRSMPFAQRELPQDVQ
jgi:murein DD-endopeptidase MepM/ murein hydrolase activator NlpD